MKFTFYTPVAYDYKLAYATIMSYYDIADEILLGLDESRISWAGKKFEFDDGFYDTISAMDKDKKIKIIEKNFHTYKNAIDNDTCERNYLTCRSVPGNYHIGIDSDEILLNPKEFLDWLKKTSVSPFDVDATWYTVYKSFGDKLLVTNPLEPARIGTRLRGKYRKCRVTAQRGIMSPLKMLHYSWGRKREEVVQKLENWSHTNDFNCKEYMVTWDSVNLENYKEKKNLHPLKIKQWWKSLDVFDVNDFDIPKEIKEKLK